MVTSPSSILDLWFASSSSRTWGGNRKQNLFGFLGGAVCLTLKQSLSKISEQNPANPDFNRED